MVLLAGALRAPAVGAGYHMDDIAQVAMVRGVYGVERSALDLYNFVSGDAAEWAALTERGALPWWSDPNLRLRALRPLSSALIWFDVEVLDANPVGAHLHSLLWWAALLCAAAVLLRRVVPPPVAAVAVALYALDECHTYPIAWIANRNAIVSATFAFLAVWAHLRWREDGWRGGAATSVVALALAFAGGEYALCGLGYIVAYELLGARGSAIRRARAALPAAAVGIAYAVVHRGLGFGAHASGVYADPLSDPGEFLVAAATRLPALAADLFLAIPSGALVLHPSFVAPVVAAGIVAALGVALLVRGTQGEDRPRLGWLALASLLAAVPMASSFVSARLLLIPALAGHAIIAWVVVDGWTRLRGPKAGARGALRIGIAGLLAVAHGLVAPYVAAHDLHDIRRFNDATRTRALAMQADEGRLGAQRLAVLAASDPMTLLYPPLSRWLAGRARPRAWWVLSMAPHRHQMTRVGPRAIELEVQDGAMLRGAVEQMFRDPDAVLRPGDRITITGLTVDILAVAGDGAPNRVRFTFDRRLEDPDLLFMLVSPRGILSYPMGPVGAQMLIAPGAPPAADGKGGVR